MLRLLLCGIFFMASMSTPGQENFATDVFKTAAGELKITFIGHGSLLFTYQDRTIYIDPFGALTDFSRLPKADLIFITHQHQDHFDAAAIESLRKENTEIFLSASCQPYPAASHVLKNGDRITTHGIEVSVVPAYNVIHKRDNGVPFHPRGEGNGYVFAFSDWRVYVAGDTENIPEMAALKDIAVAFLPMNLPYTMTPEMTAQAARAFKPRILYPYHYGSSDPRQLVELLKSDPDGIDVRIRKMN
ncbi:MAG: MBL fold metallo-hydrolase [Candidatus Aminicenantes bacterium]|nr:MBL fold metallo-hydrolase [Candidatus Aminicenantes bacterium]